MSVFGQSLIFDVNIRAMSTVTLPFPIKTILLLFLNSLKKFQFLNL